MTGDTSGAGDEQPWLAALLRAEAERHAPDLAAVHRRLTAEPAGQRPPSEPPPGRRRAGTAWAVAGVLVATAAGGLAVAGISDLVLAAGDARPVRVLPATPAPAAGPDATPAPTATPAQAAGGTLAATAPGVARTRPSPGPGVAVRPAAPGHRVGLSGALDWVVAGSRRDGTTVRRRAGGQVLGGPHLVGDPRARVAPGPFRTSWTGGLPDASGSGVGTWLTVRGRPGGPRTGFVVSAPAGASSLTLYAGAGAAGARVTVLVDGRGRDVAALPAAPRGAPAGHVVTVRVEGPGRVEVRVDAAGDGVVALAAAVAR